MRFLVHYGRHHLLEPDYHDLAILLGDYLYAHGLVHVARLGDVDAVAALAELISRCAHLRGEQAPGDGEVWADTMDRLGGNGGDRTAALAAHARRVG